MPWKGVSSGIGSNLNQRQVDGTVDFLVVWIKLELLTFQVNSFTLISLMTGKKYSHIWDLEKDIPDMRYDYGPLAHGDVIWEVTEPKVL